MEAATLLAGNTAESDASPGHSTPLPTPPSSSSCKPSALLPIPAAATSADTPITTDTACRALQLLRTAEGLCVKLVAVDQIRAKSWTRRALALRQRVALAAPLVE
jgi:hypothetical protein